MYCWIKSNNSGGTMYENKPHKSPKPTAKAQINLIYL